MRRFKLIRLEQSKAAQIAASLILRSIFDVLDRYGFCTIILTGGRSASSIYKELALLDQFKEIRCVKFLFGDERCVPLRHRDSNYGMVMQTLFKYGVPPDCHVLPMLSEDCSYQSSAERYQMYLPSRIDILLLSMGDDGHIASLFPRDIALFEKDKSVVIVQDPSSYGYRLTITPRVIDNAERVFVFAFGGSKAEYLKIALADQTNILDIPARLVLNAEWLVDTEIEI